MSLTSIQRIMQKGIHSFGQNSNGTNRKRHHVGDPSAVVSLYLPNGDTFEERCYIKEPLAQQITRILNELRRQGSLFMKKKYYYHALHPVDLLIIDEDHKFIPNDRPPGNWPTLVKCIMQERKPVIYVWSFKFCERDKVSFPDVARMTQHHKFFEDKKSGVIDEAQHSPQNSEEIPRTNSSLEFASKRMPIQFGDSQSPPKAKPRVRGNNLANSISQFNSHAPPLPPKTKCSSLNSLDERNGQLTLPKGARSDFNTPINGAIDSLTSDIKELNIKRNKNHSKRQPLLPPSISKFTMNMDEARSKIPMPVPPLRNSSARRSKVVNSFILPVSPDDEFSDNFSSLSRDISFYQQERDNSFYEDVSYNSSIISPHIPSTPPYPPHPHLLPNSPSYSNVSTLYRQDIPVTPLIHANKFKPPRFSLYEREQNKIPVPTHINGYLNHSCTPILPAIPPKMKSLKSSIPTPVAKPRKKSSDTITTNRLSTIQTRNNTTFRPLPIPQTQLAALTPNYPRMRPSSTVHIQPPNLPPKKQTKNTTDLILPMVPPRIKSHQISAFHPFNY